MDNDESPYVGLNGAGDGVGCFNLIWKICDVPLSSNFSALGGGWCLKSLESVILAWSIFIGLLTVSGLVLLLN